MGKVLISSNYMTDIADAVRTKLSTNDRFSTNKIAENILSIDSGLSSSVIADGYSSLKTYAVGDYVIYQDKLYVCTTAISTSENFDATHWSETTVGHELSEILSTMLPAGDTDE